MYINAAVVFKPAGEFKIENLEICEPCDDEVLVRVVSTGICHTDLLARDQHFPTPLPAVFGHEGAGVDEKIGNKVTKVKPGDHVVLTWNYCGKCPLCKSGKYSYCHYIGRNFSYP